MSMSITEQAAYIKGLVEGLGIDESTREGKIIKAMSALLCDMAQQVDDLENDLDDTCEQMDEVSEKVDFIDDIFKHIVKDEDMDDDSDEDEQYYEVACPQCGETVYVSEDDLDAGEAICPSCKTEFEVAIADEDDEAGDDGPARYEATCLQCGEEVELSEEDLLGDEPKCPKCGAPLRY